MEEIFISVYSSAFVLGYTHTLTRDVFARALGNSTYLSVPFVRADCLGPASPSSGHCEKWQDSLSSSIDVQTQIPARMHSLATATKDNFFLARRDRYTAHTHTHTQSTLFHSQPSLSILGNCFCLVSHRTILPFPLSSFLNLWTPAFKLMKAMCFQKN